MLGQFRLTASQISRLGQTFKAETFEDSEQQGELIAATEKKMVQAGLPNFQIRGNYLMSAAGHEKSLDGVRLGHYRVKFEWAPCDQCSIVAQQVQSNEGTRTFRKWNPKKINVPYGQETSADADETCADGVCCLICKCVNCFMNAAFEEVIDFVVEGIQEAEDIFNKNEESMKTVGNIIRPVSIVLCTIGFYLLFMPVIKLLAWVPLVGSLLSAVAGLAAFVFALVVGGTVACLVLGLAWLFYRPIIGITLLFVTAIGIALIFMTGGSTPVI